MVKCGEDFFETSSRRKPTSKSSTTFFPPNFCRFPGSPTSRLNPGTVYNLHKKTRDLMPEWHEGLNLRCARNLDVHKKLLAEWALGNNTPAGFRIGGMFCRKDNDNITKTPLIFGDTNPSTLATNLHALYHPRPNIRLKSTLQTSALPLASDFIRKATGLLEFLGESSTITLAFDKPKRESGRMTIGILQSFNNNFCAGLELLAAWKASKLTQYDAALAGRFSFHKSTVAVMVSKDALEVSAWRQPSESLQLGASFIFNKLTSKAVGSFYYQLEMRDAIIKGMMDSNWAVGCTYNRQLKNLASAFGFSVLFCIPTNKLYCGLKFELNSNLQ